MTEDSTPLLASREHNKACVLRSTVEHNDASDHLNWSGKIVSTRKKNAVERPFYGRDSCEEKKSKKKNEKKKTHGHLLLGIRRCQQSKLQGLSLGFPPSMRSSVALRNQQKSSSPFGTERQRAEILSSRKSTLQKMSTEDWVHTRVTEHATGQENIVHTSLENHDKQQAR